MLGTWEGLGGAGKEHSAARAPAAAKRSPATSRPLSAALASSPSSFPTLGSGSLREQNPHLLILKLTTLRYRKFAPWQFIILSGKPTYKQRTGRGAPQGGRDCHLAVSPLPLSLCPRSGSQGHSAHPPNANIFIYVPHKPISLLILFSSGETMYIFQGSCPSNTRNTK